MFLFPNAVKRHHMTEQGGHMSTIRDDDGQRGLLSTFQAADYLGVPRETLAVWRMRKTGPRYSKIGRHVKYRQADLDAWVESRTIPTGARS